MKCSEAQIHIDSVLDGEASFQEEQALRFHLNGCADCRKVMLLNKAISKNIKKLHEPSPPEDLMAMVRARLISGNFDKSPLVANKFFFSSNRWKVAAIIPFVATLLFLLHTIQEKQAVSTYSASSQIETIPTTNVRYEPAPIIAYTRPSSISTF